MEERSNAVLEGLVELATKYAGRRARPDNRIFADLDINGSDLIEFVKDVERRHGVDLSWVSPHQLGAIAQDPTIQALAEDVLRQKG